MAIAGVVVVSVALALSACSSSSNRGGGGGSSAAGGSGDLLASVKKSGTLTIGSSNQAPWSVVSDSGTADGIVPDILEAYFEHKGWNVKLKPTAMPFNSLIPALTSTRVQAVGDVMYVTPEREKQVAFSTILFYNPDALVVAKGNPLKINDLSGLCGHVGATYQGTVWVDDLKAASKACPAGKPIQVKVYSTIYEAMQDISTGRVNGALVDSATVSLAIQKNPGLGIELSDYTPPDESKEGDAFAVRKGDTAFLKDFATVYAQMKADGTVKKILEKWGLKPASRYLTLK